MNIDLKNIKELAKEMAEQNNRATQYPLFYVQSRTDRWVNSEDTWDIIYYIDEDGEKVGEGNEDLEEFKTEDGETVPVRNAYIKFVWEDQNDVGPFLTEKAADAHILSNNYHYTEPRTYVHSAWRNWELQSLFKLIFQLAEMEIPSQYR